jgi:hypothetical protein
VVGLGPGLLLLAGERARRAGKYGLSFTSAGVVCLWEFFCSPLFLAKDSPLYSLIAH